MSAPARMYYLAHVLPAALDAPIRRIKEDLQQRFGCRVGLKSPAHITLGPPFWLPQEREGALTADLDALSTTTPFFLQTHGLASFGRRTLYIAVAQSLPLQQLKAAADALFAGKGQYGIKADQRPFHPHITLATRDLKPASFLEAWALYQGHSFSYEWVAESIALLRHAGSHWELLHEVLFKK